MCENVKIDYMNLKRLFLLPLVVCLCSCVYGKNGYTKFNFRHQQAATDYNDYMYYSDAIFDKDADEFNPKLASASISFAMASFASMDETNYANKSKNAKTLLENIGFKEFETNQMYKEKPQSDTIGVLAANKRVGNYTVVAISFRGAAYFSEWASNFTLGNREDGYHEGFRTAADNALSFVKDYFANKNIHGDIKIWTTGYSRGGATCNIMSGLIDESLNKGEKPFGDSVNLTRNHLYAYCFEAPQGAPNRRDSENHVIVKSNAFNNIFNILNVNDPVPLVAMHELGFTRYGVDLYLPDPLTVLDYKGHFENMNYLYDRMDNHLVLGSYQIDQFKYKGISEAHSMSQGLFLKDFIADLSLQGISHCGTIPMDECLDFYVNNVQTGLRSLFKTLYESEQFKGSLVDIGIAMLSDLGVLDELDYLVSDLIVEGSDAFINDFRPILTRGLNSLNLDIDVKQTVDELLEFLKIIGSEMFAAVLSGKNYELLSWFNKDNIKSIASGHYPELCAAHVRALDDSFVDNPFTDYEKMDGQYYYLKVDYTREPIVIKHNGKVIVNINNGEEIDNSISYCRKVATYEIYLPYHEHYEVQFGENVDMELYYYSNEYQEMVELKASLDVNNSFNI